MSARASENRVIDSEHQHHCRNGVMSVQYWSRRALRTKDMNTELRCILETIFAESCRVERTLDNQLKRLGFSTGTSIEEEQMKQTHGTWGERIETFGWDGGIVTLLYLKPNKRCSYHHHNKSWNQFFVITGKLGVLTEFGFTEVNQKQSFLVQPGLKHEFQTFDEFTLVQEIAFVRYESSDIIRENEGGDR